MTNVPVPPECRLTYSEHQNLAGMLNKLTVIGQLAKAYQLVSGLDLADAKIVSLCAGYSCLGGSQSNERQWQHLQDQIAKHANARTMPAHN